jgi:hypothetical protein
MPHPVDRPNPIGTEIITPADPHPEPLLDRIRRNERPEVATETPGAGDDHRVSGIGLAFTV